MGPHSCSLQVSAALRDLPIAESSEPQAATQTLGVRLEFVPSTRLQQAQQAFGNHRTGLIAFEIDQTLMALASGGPRRRIDTAGLLRVVHQVVGVQADERDTALSQAGGFHFGTQGGEVTVRLRRVISVERRARVIW
jgi:hypothetical protein